MACTNCSTEKGDSGLPKGCQNKGTCGTDGCNKLSVFDWLSNMVHPSGTEVYDIVEVRFKNGRKDFYRYGNEITLSMGDIVATESSPGHDIGIVSLTGQLVKVQMKKKKAVDNDQVLKIYRKATQKDVDVWQAAREREEVVRMRAREIAISLNLEMKISDVEFQGDGSKATFYYTASERVDFRQLIKEFAREFSIRIEMKQVGFRQEAARLGGVGSCGRELCCSTWLTDFRSVNTSAARYQQLSLNPQKLAGQCGKLKCCLNFELDTYLEALKDFPDIETRLFTVKGMAVCQKIDIFKEQMWFAYANNSANWFVLKVEQVKEIIALNKRDEKGQELESYVLDSDVDDVIVNVVEEDSVTRFDQPKRKKKPRRKPREAEGAERTSREAREPRGRNRQEGKQDKKQEPKTEGRPENRRERTPRPRPAAKKTANDQTQGEGASPRTGQDAPKGNQPNRNAERNKSGVSGENKQAPRAPKAPKATGDQINAGENRAEQKPRPKKNRNKRPKNSNNSNDNAVKE